MPLRHLQEGHWHGRRVHSMPYRAVVADAERRCCGLRGEADKGGDSSFLVHVHEQPDFARMGQLCLYTLSAAVLVD
jgi:hypothetical protein